MPSFVFLITTLPVPILTLFPIVNPCNTVHLTPKKLALPTFVSPDIRTSGCITLQSPIVTSCPNETQPFIRLKFPIVTPQLTLPPNVITFPCPIRIDSSSKKRNRTIESTVRFSLSEDFLIRYYSASIPHCCLARRL